MENYFWKNVKLRKEPETKLPKNGTELLKKKKIYRQKLEPNGRKYLTTDNLSPSVI